jgi:hypothetical protein
MMHRSAGLAHQDYMLHGVAIRVCWDDPTLAQHLWTICTYVGLQAAPSAGVEPQVTLTFVTHARGLSIPLGACRMAEHAGIHAWHVAPQMYLRAGEVVVQLDPTAGTGIGTLRPASGHAPRRLRKDLVLYSLLWLLRYRGLYAIHAAGVAHDNAGCVLVAERDSGKSTLAFSLVRQGWGHLSDDALLLRACGDGIEALSLRPEVCLDPEAARYFPDIVAHWQPCLVADEVKQRLNVTALYPERVLSACLPRLLIFPRIVAAPASQLRPVGKAEALWHLIRQSALLGLEPHLAPHHLDVLTRLVNQTTRYELLAGHDLGQRPALIAPLLIDLMAQAGHPGKGG